MSKLTYTKSYFDQICDQFNSDKKTDANLYNEFLFYWDEKGSLNARYYLLNQLKK